MISFALMMLVAVQAAPATAPAPDAPAAKPKKICRTTAESGTRLGRTRICKTADEWLVEDRHAGGAVAPGDLSRATRSN